MYRRIIRKNINVFVLKRQVKTGHVQVFNHEEGC